MQNHTDNNPGSGQIWGSWSCEAGMLSNVPPCHHFSIPCPCRKSPHFHQHYPPCLFHSLAPEHATWLVRTYKKKSAFGTRILCDYRAKFVWTTHTVRNDALRVFFLCKLHCFCSLTLIFITYCCKTDLNLICWTFRPQCTITNKSCAPVTWRCEQKNI